MHDKPFDVNTIEEDIAASLSETHDITGSRIGLRRKERRDDHREDSGSPAPLPKSLTETLQAQGSIETILAERRTVHGDFTDNAATSQAIKYIMEHTTGWSSLNAVEAEALHMIAHKIGRILAGNPHYKDHWDDIASYARLVSERI